MKKWTSIFLLLFLLINTSAYFFIFKVQQKSLRKEAKLLMRSNPDKKSLERIAIPNEWLHRTDKIKFEHSFEFIFEGKLYDIISKEKKADSTIFYCINDKNEEKLIAKYKEDVRKNNSSNNPSQKSKQLRNLISYYIYPENPIFENVFNINQIKFTDISLHYLSINMDLSSPPPKV